MRGPAGSQLRALPGGGTRAGNPVRCFLPPALRHPREAIFDKSFAHLHICSAAAGQEKSLRAGPGAETSAESPGHIRCGLPPARTPPFFPPPGLARQPPPLWIFPSLLPIPGVSVSFHLSADVETGKIFMQPKARFLREAASSSSARGGLTLSSAPPPPSSQSQIVQGWGGGQGWKKAGEIGASPWYQKVGAQMKVLGNAVTPPLHHFTYFWLSWGGGIVPGTSPTHSGALPEGQLLDLGMVTGPWGRWHGH